jgi:hypothetical protein
VPELCAGISTAGLVSLIGSAQNPDGGWGYRGGSSWTEATAFALLALSAAHSRAEPFQRGVQWLVKTQRVDGGWAPHAGVLVSTWVTAPAVLALTEADRAGNLPAAVAWLLRQTGEESTLTDRLRSLLLGIRMEAGEGTRGWPWLAGTAGWVMPTALTILALEKAELLRRATGTRERVQQGYEFLLERTCADGGWNYGAAQALGYQANSYPDTTGMALLALHGVRSPKITAALAKAESQLPQCHSAQTLCWLRIGLAAHGQKLPQAGDCSLESAGLLDRALVLLARAADEQHLSVWGAA